MLSFAPHKNTKEAQGILVIARIRMQVHYRKGPLLITVELSTTERHVTASIRSPLLRSIKATTYITAKHKTPNSEPDDLYILFQFVRGIV